MARRRPTEGLGLAIGLALVLAGCGAPPPQALAPARAPQRSAEVQDGTAAGQVSQGFTALATPQQVLQGLPIGRLDPFAPVTASAAGLTLPPGLRLRGVLRSGGRLQAIVQLGGSSGPICLGPRGACPGSGVPPLLPPGWSVAGINAARGQVQLRQGAQLTLLSL